MKAELVKREDRWDLYGEDGSKIASSAPNPFKRLSLKNCEAIANGYDLDDLAKIEYPICEVWNDEEALIRKLAFTESSDIFNKVIKIVDKKNNDLSNRACDIRTN